MVVPILFQFGCTKPVPSWLYQTCSIGSRRGQNKPLLVSYTSIGPFLVPWHKLYTTMELVPVPLVPTCDKKWVYKAVEMSQKSRRNVTTVTTDFNKTSFCMYCLKEKRLTRCLFAWNVSKCLNLLCHRAGCVVASHSHSEATLLGSVGQSDLAKADTSLHLFAVHILQ